MTLSQYYAAYKSLLGIIAGLASASPLLALIPIGADKYIFPPLGNVDIVARLISVTAALLATFFVYFVRSTNSLRAIAIASSLFVLFAILYTAAFSSFVRTIEIPAQKTSVSLSVGFTRTEFARKEFAGVSDEQILRFRGLSEEEIRRCWTPASLLIARALLWISCTSALMALLAALGFGILATDDPTLGGIAAQE